MENSEIKALEKLYKDNTGAIADEMMKPLNKRALKEALVSIIHELHNKDFNVFEFYGQDLELLVDEIRDAAVKIVERQQ